MDTGPTRSARQRQTPTFNGATAFQPWIHERWRYHVRRVGILQWSHGFSAMDTIGDDPCRGDALDPSMEPRLFSHGYLTRAHGWSSTCTSLQWSHGFSAMDTSPMSSKSEVDESPSMEPRLFSHGYFRLCRPQHPARRSFNGATAFQPWIHRLRGRQQAVVLTLQWSHGFSAMDTRHVRRHRGRKLGRLQWSHGFSAMDTSIPVTGNIGINHPSMEPRLFSHGYRGFFALLDATAHAFNGATAFQPWILAGTGRTGPQHGAFNGATAFQPWILAKAVTRVLSDPTLQWSHGFSAMDTFSARPPAPLSDRPSMEPRLFSHGYVAANGAGDGFVVPFNGATAFQPWIRRQPLHGQRRR